MEQQQAEEKAFSDLGSDYRRQLIKEYEDLIKLVTVLKDPIHRQVLATAKNLQINDDFGLEESIRFSIRKRKYLLDQMFDEYQRPSYSGEIQRNTVQSTCNPLFHSLKMEAVHRTALRKSRCDIIDLLLNNTSKLDSILDYLNVNGHILTDSLLEEIQSERSYRSRIRRLLDITPKRGPHAYYVFLNCLNEHGFDTL